MTDHVCPSCGADWGAGKFTAPRDVQSRMGAAIINHVVECEGCSREVDAALRAHHGPGVADKQIVEVLSRHNIDDELSSSWLDEVINVISSLLAEQRAYDAKRAADLVKAAELALEALDAGQIAPALVALSLALERFKSALAQETTPPTGA